MTKTYVLGTNVLIQSPKAIFAFEDNNIVLPVAVLEELDHLKALDGETGANARQAIRILEQLRLSGNLVDGVALPSGGTLRLELNHKDVPLHESFSADRSDNRILRVCAGLKADGHDPIIVTKDIVVRIKAQLLSIRAEDFATEQVSRLEEQYNGRVDVFAPDELMTGFKKKGIRADSLYTVNEQDESLHIPAVFVHNQFVLIRSEISTKKTMLGRFDGDIVVPLNHGDKRPFGVTPRNVGQYFLQEALMKSAGKAPLVIVKGPAGTAKTFYSLAVGLHHILDDERTYRRIVVTRPNTQFDEDIGFLPGSEQEKIAPLMRPVIDNLEMLVDQDEKQRYRNENELRGKIDEIFDRGYIVAEAMNFIRGRSITHTYLIIDEAQNLTPRQAKGIITRAGKGTKIVMLGDPAQIDHPLLDERTNGLSYAAEKMKGSRFCYQVTMMPDECERSALATDSAARL